MFGMMFVVSGCSWLMIPEIVMAKLPKKLMAFIGLHIMGLCPYAETP